MPEYRRPRIPGSTIFFTVNLAERGDDLLVREIERLRQAFADTLSTQPCGSDALVILPDHLHAVWTLPDDDRDYSGRWGKIKSLFVRELPAGSLRQSHRKRGEGVSGRGASGSIMRGPAEHHALVQYCWNNPVKHGLVTRAVDWPYSSTHRDIRLGRAAPELSGIVFAGEFRELVG